MARQQSEAGDRRDGSNAWLMRVAYDLLGPILTRDELGMLELWIKLKKRYQPQGVPSGLNPFQIGLMAIFANDRDAISARTRERLGKRLWHAYRHYVPIEFLPGFIKQLESAGFEQRAAKGQIEPGFADWIVRQRASDSNRNARGAFPKSLENRVIKRSKKRNVALNTSSDDY